MATASNRAVQAGARHRVLGIETSCDETGIAIFDSAAGVVANKLHSQIELHRAYGGVVPELASRDHIRRLVPLYRAALAEAGLAPAELDAIAYTAGPGLVGALLTGAAFGRSLAYGLQVPAIAVHHMEAHLLSPLIEDPTLEPPFVALLVSGGHSQLHRVRGIGDYELLGDTLDDAAGEAFDKTAKMLGLPYPGGPAIAALAEQGRPDRFRFSRPMLDRPGCDFSFSGLKTQVMLAWRDSDQTDATRADIARAFEEAVVDVLVAKCGRAVAAAGVRTLVISGGVGANRRLRAALGAYGDEAGIRVAFPSPALCTDNGAMVAFAGSLRFAANDWAGPGIEVRARWPLAELPAMPQAS